MAEAFQARLQTALQRHLGAGLQLTAAERLTAGATKQTWLIDVEGLAPGPGASEGPRGERLILQLSPSGAENATNSGASRGHQSSSNDVNGLKLSPAQDARLSQLARAHGVPAPEVLAVLHDADGLGDGPMAGLLTRFVPGETLAPRILREPALAAARGALPAQCAQALARIHALPVGEAGFLPLRTASSQWQGMRDTVDALGVQHPALEWGLGWVQERMAGIDASLAAPCVVHGDFRLGNLIIDANGLACVIDWELAMRADPMLDLAWLCLRTWRFGGAGEMAGVGDRSVFHAAYARCTGTPVDTERVFFWEMFCQLRWAVMCLGMGLGPPGAASDAISLEHRLVGRRMEEPLWDMLRMAQARNGHPADGAPTLAVAMGQTRSVPSDTDLLAAAIRQLEDSLLPALAGKPRFEARLVANALKMLQRAQQPPSVASTQTHAMCHWTEGIRKGAVQLNDPALLIALESALRASLAVCNPKWLH